MDVSKLLFFCCLLSCLSFSSAYGVVTTSVEVQGRQLLVNGSAFIMKGVCYHPVRKGETIPDGLMTAHPTEDDLKVIENDFQLIHDAGFNTIRTYKPILDPGILKLLWKYKLYVIVSICLSYDDYKNLDSIKQIVEQLKEEPSTLFWEIGNEWNFNHFYTNTNFIDHISNPNLLTELECDEIIENVSKLIKNIDNHHHPIGTDIMILNNRLDYLYSGIAPSIEENVDLYGANIYDGKSFGNRFNEWKDMTQKPFYLGEFGSVSYNEDTKQEDTESQNEANLSLFNEILANASAKDAQNNILVGGCIFEFCDEWWKGGNPDPSTHKPTGLFVDRGPFPSNCFDDEYFGIVDIDRNPKATYFSLKKLFKEQDKDQTQ
ncbi:MAG: hypothetical protein ACOYK6_03185 [Chthoniobacterales bacterium]